MTYDHFHAQDIFTYKIKYAKVCTGIYGNKRQKNISAVLRFEKAFLRDVFRFNPFSTFRETS